MIKIQNLSLDLPGFSLNNVDLDVAEGEFFALLGPTGSGKTLILEAIAGLIKPTQGKILLNGQDAARLPPEKRNVGLVYQDYALFPHLNVIDNIRYPLRRKPQYKKQNQERADWLIQILGLSKLTKRKPDTLSGGEKQRVSLARGLAAAPKALLLDEPLSALDPNFRDDLRKLLKKLHKELDTTFLLVTHDFAEVMFLAERAAILNQGSIEQCGPINEIFQHPATPFASEFVGMKNIFPARFESDRVEFAGLSCPFQAPAPNGQKHVALRPEDIKLRASDRFPENFISFKGEIQRVIYLGYCYEVDVRCAQARFKVYVDKISLHSEKFAEDQTVLLGFNPQTLHAF